jgi:hypothetical protein
MSINPTLYDVLDSGRELHITVNGNTFVMVKIANRVVADANGERMWFEGCKNNEIKQVLAEYEPGAWRKPWE